MRCEKLLSVPLQCLNLGHPHTPVNAYLINLYYINYIDINELSKQLKTIRLIYICGGHYLWCYWHYGYCCC